MIHDDTAAALFAEMTHLKDVQLVREHAASGVLSTAPTAGEQSAVLMSAAVQLCLEHGLSPIEILESMSQVVFLMAAVHEAKRTAS